MSPYFRRAGAAALVALLCACTSVAASPAQKRRAGAGSNRSNDAGRHSRKAAEVLNKIMRIPDRAIPRDLLADAEAVAVCPSVLKAAFIVGGRKGDCVISRRTLKRGWGAPIFYNMAGGSFGAQIGGASTDYVLLFMNEEALRGLMSDKFEIGGEAGVAAGPVGRTIGAGTTPRLEAGILSWSRSRGAFVGAAIKGVAITPDNDLNEAFYGKKASELVESRADQPVPPVVRALPLALSRYSVRPPR